jgi:hypothetical protein
LSITLPPLYWNCIYIPAIHAFIPLYYTPTRHAIVDQPYLYCIPAPVTEHSQLSSPDPAKMSGPSRYDPSLDFDSGDGDLSIPGSMTSPQLGTFSSQSRRHVDMPNTPTRSNTINGRSSQFSGANSEAGPSRMRPHTPSTPHQENGKPTMERTESQPQRSRSLNMHKKLPQLFTRTSAKSPLSATDRIGYSRRPGDPRPPPLITPEIARKVGRWIKEMVVCNFDLERGPVVERRIIGRRWGPGEKENVYVCL